MNVAKSTSGFPTRSADISAIGLSTLCLIHCLGLPLLIALAPAAFSWADTEWLHKAFVLLALVISVPLIVARRTTHYPNGSRKFQTT